MAKEMIKTVSLEKTIKAYADWCRQYREGLSKEAQDALRGGVTKP